MRIQQGVVGFRHRNPSLSLYATDKKSNSIMQPSMNKQPVTPGYAVRTVNISFHSTPLSRNRYKCTPCDPNTGLLQRMTRPFPATLPAMFRCIPRETLPLPCFAARRVDTICLVPSLGMPTGGVGVPPSDKPAPKIGKHLGNIFPESGLCRKNNTDKKKPVASAPRLAIPPMSALALPKVALPPCAGQPQKPDFRVC